MNRHLATMVFGLVLVAGCGDNAGQPDGRVDKGPTMGTLGAPCYPNSTCNAGLTCNAGICAAGDAAVDSARREGGGPDGPTAVCATPGTSCVLADPCVIDPVCGADHVCRATKMQNCDDGLACTTDVCKGMGRCEHTPLPKACVLPTVVAGKPKLQCYAEGDRNPADPCSECAPSTSATSWSPANSGACDDGDPCTKNDYCQAGACAGTPYGVQCDDGLSCTDDQCDGKGGCLANKLKSTACLINNVCYDDGQGDLTGCNLCDVSKSPSAWTPLVGGCTIKSQCFKAGTRDVTGCSSCDPTKSTTDWTPLAAGSVCAISGTCYLKAETHPGGCGVCDPAQSATAWTVTGANCLIGDACYPSGQTDVTGCGSCDPLKSKTAWTPVVDSCLIDGKCHTKGTVGITPCGVCDPTLSGTSWTIVGTACLIDKVCYAPAQLDKTGCGSCDPMKSKTAFTPLTNKCLVGGLCFSDLDPNPKTACLLCKYATNPTGWTPVAGVKPTAYTFEDGKSPPTGWTLTNTDPKVGWGVTSKRPGAGSYSLYYGDPVAGNFAGAGANSGSAKLPPVTLTAGKKSAISFLAYFDTEGGASYDMLQIFVGTAKIWEKDAPSTPPVLQKAWQTVTVDLSAYAGQTITIELKFDTGDAINNTSEGVYVDDVTIYDGC
jgi:hypothetical protein